MNSSFPPARSAQITDGDVILVYGRSYSVELALKMAKEEGKAFRVVIADSRPLLEGRRLLASLSAAGIPTTYVNLNAASYVMRTVSKAFLGAAAMLSNGAVISRAGTAVGALKRKGGERALGRDAAVTACLVCLASHSVPSRPCALCTPHHPTPPPPALISVAMMARRFNIPAIFCCETYKFSDKVQLDSICWNEIGDPSELTPSGADDNHAHAPTAAAAPAPAAGSGSARQQAPKVLNIRYDLTPMKYVSLVLTEVGMIPPTSVPVLIREYNKDDVSLTFDF